MPKPSLDRRGFLKRGGAASLGALAAPWAMNLAAMADAAAAAADATDDYKAVVCVFLQGGNDHGNTLIPVDDAGHAVYARLRGGLALPRAQLGASTLLNPVTSAGLQGRQLALAPSLSSLQGLFNTERRLAALLNIGPLRQPTTLAQFRARSVSLPRKLFSHNDQQSVWQSFEPEGSTVGWGGRLADQGLALNATAALTCVNLSGNAVFGAGERAGQFMVNPLGPERVQALDTASFLGSAACVDAFRKLVRTDDPSVHRVAKEHSLIMRRAMDVNALLLDQLAAVASPPARGPTGNPLADQLRTAVRIMAAHRQLGAAGAGGLKRQVFFVQMGGFDLHDNLLSQHPVLLQRLADALVQLDDDLGQLGMRKQVTAFTASDFGRTLSSNGDGSDHGWGGHHFVLGGAVQGGRFFGTWPDVTDFDAGEHNIGQGRLLPTLAVDHLSDALARWMGVTDPQALAALAPNLRNFPGASPLAGLF